MKRLVVLTVLVAAGALSMGVLLAQPTNGDIRIEKVKDNLYIVTGGRQGGGIAGNTTVFIADSGVVLIDAKYAGFGKAILDQVKSVTSKPVTTIINTHSHGDHTGGNPDFPRSVEFIAHENAKANMARMEEFKGPKAAFLPAKTFKDTMSLFSGKDRIDLRYFGAGHTNGDAVIVFPALRTVVMGDLFARKWAPFADATNGGNMTAFPQTLAKAIGGHQGCGYGHHRPRHHDDRTGGGRGLLDDPHPRAHARRRAELRGGGLPGDHGGDPAAPCDDVVINYSTGAIGIPIQKRIEYLRELRPDVAALNMGSMNYAKYSSKRKDFVFKTVFENSFDTIIEFVTVMNELGIRPEHECFDSGHVANLDPLIDMGLLSEPLQVSCVMGVTGGIRPTPENLAHMSEQVPEVRHNWGVIGISRDQWRLIAAAAALGGNVRAGLEDNFYLPDGEMAALQRRPDREGARDRGERRPAGGNRRRGPRAARRMSALEDIRVLDLSRLLPGGFCSLLLADFGAEVLKVEDTGMGDYIRWSPPYLRGSGRLGQVRARSCRSTAASGPSVSISNKTRQDRFSCASFATTTFSSSRSVLASWSGSALATSACARRTRGSCTARSAAMGRTARTPGAPGTT